MERDTMKAPTTVLSVRYVTRIRDPRLVVVTSWFVRSSPVSDIVLCSWARHLTLTVPLSTLVYNWLQANLILRVSL